MKHKSYYFLFPLYFAVLLFVLYLNGIFEGTISSFSNLFINISILLIIGVLFAISTKSFLRLSRCTEALKQASAEIEAAARAQDGTNLWSLYKEKESIFNHPILDASYKRYQKRLNSFAAKRGLLQTCELEEYINEDLLDQIGASHFNSNIPGTMTGLGIFGTFFGLSLGLGAFSGNDIFTISDNVGPLLDGMKVAFHTSVYGIFFSLIFTFIYRGMMAYSYEVLDEFLTLHREHVMPAAAFDDSENAKAMLIYQANMANSMKSMLELMKGTAAEQTLCMERMVENFSKQLSEHMGTDFAKLGSTLNKVCDAHSAYAKNYEAMTQNAETLLESNHILQTALETALQQQEAFRKELKKQQEQLNETCSSISHDISNQLYTFEQMRSYYEK